MTRDRILTLWARDPMRLTLFILISTTIVIPLPGCDKPSNSSQPAQKVTTAEAPPATKPKIPESAAPPIDPEASYRALLADLVIDDGLVHYDLLKDPSRLDQLRAIVKAIGEKDLPDDRNERLAFWCNAYNANVLLMAFIEQRRSDFKNVAQVPGFFDKKSITVAQEELTLNDLENLRIRPLDDARIHAALVCAAMSCPPLRAEPYDAETLDAQFDDQCARWVNDRSKFRVTDGKIGLSEILNWYGEDFQELPFSSPLGFVLAYASPDNSLRDAILSEPRPDTIWLQYDWTLNEAPSEESES